MPRSDSLTLDPMWPAIAARLQALPQSSLPLAEVARAHGVGLTRLRRAIAASGLVRPSAPVSVAHITISVPATQERAVLEVCARRGWAVLEDSTGPEVKL